MAMIGVEVMKHVHVVLAYLESNYHSKSNGMKYIEVYAIPSELWHNYLCFMEVCFFLILHRKGAVLV